MAKEEYTLGSVNMQERRGGPPGRGGRVAEKPKNMKNAWLAILNYCRAEAVWFIAALSCTVVSVLLTLFAPDQLSRITDIISDGMDSGAIDTDLVVRISVVVALFYIFSALLSYAKSFTLITTTQRIMKQLRTDIDQKLNRLPLKQFDSSSFGDVLSRVTNDVDTLGQSLNNALSQVVSASIEIVGSCIMMAITNWILALIAIFSGLIGVVGMNIIMRYSQKYFKSRQQYLGLLNGYIEETYAGHEIVKAYGGEKSALKEFDELNEKLYDNNFRSQFFGGIMNPMMLFVGNLGYVCVCIAGAVLANRGVISFGTIVAFILYIKMFTQPLGQVAQLAVELQSAAASAERVFEFLETTEMEDESDKTTQLNPADGSVKGEVEFSHVKFGYDPGRTIIHDFSVHIPPGAKVAIVGPTGAGKTTIVNLLMRFYELDDGFITVDGRKLEDLTRENVHALFCMVLQDSWLFEGTIRENIVYSKENVPDEKVVEACKSVGLHRYISSLPKGYDTVLSDATNMSAGQRQLLTIVRAIVDDAPLLILDEATSSVDTRTEQMVQWAMDQLTQGRTSFTIAHRLSTIRNADIILVMQDGDIVETGNHEELLAKNGFYAQLWNSQFVNAETI